MDLKVIYIYIILILYFISESYEKEFIIRNSDNTFINLKKIINDNQNEELILNFVDSYYDMSIHDYVVEVTILENTIIRGNINGTLFDYNGQRRCSMIFLISNINKGKTVIIENIIFENYIPKDYNNNNQILQIKSESSINYYFKFNNCTFRNNNQDILSVNIEENKNIFDDFSVEFNHCNFLNNSQKILKLYNHGRFSEKDPYLKYIKVKMKNCTFINNRGLFYIIKSSLSIEKYINNVFIFSIDKYGYIDIKESVFENINVKSNYPLIFGEYLTVK
ncbi:hypothetical protein BCR36DRAFT_361777 [Piromyces finnis]|uniref:Right handed beta helix domain-containing protein n=1 Tax=Piromyces finnis TaxID=1754191 RepID=A0A1Y1UZG9_9FUNG|nr:hypothetical protein BCR36DRAFT_361777 [Piromyces finnis]|eukprot:ORX42810.1 hypothetical protein BCR36DRAFT_361777 [Piromyces finnis]